MTIYVYTSADKLENAMENESFDVVMFDPDLSESRINFFKGENADLPLQRRGGKYKSL